MLISSVLQLMLHSMFMLLLCLCTLCNTAVYMLKVNKGQNEDSVACSFGLILACFYCGCDIFVVKTMWNNSFSRFTNLRHFPGYVNLWSLLWTIVHWLGNRLSKSFMYVNINLCSRDPVVQEMAFLAYILTNLFIFSKFLEKPTIFKHFNIYFNTQK